MRLLLLLLLLPFVGATQLTYYIRSDSTKIEKTGGSNELFIKNATRGINGVLTNVGNGKTRFIASRVSGDTLFIGMDTIIGGGSQNLQQVTNNGAKTTDTIHTGGLRTHWIGADTVSEADYTIVVLPDLQYQTLFYPGEFTSIFDWIVANKTALNIKMVVGVGDMTQSNTVAEYDRLDSNYDRLDAISLPYFVIPGNHDYASASVATRDLTRYNDPAYFGIARNAAEYTAGTRRSWNGTTSETSWYKLSVGTKDYLFMGLQCFPTQAEVDWAQAQLDSFATADPHRDVWITNHAYITAHGELSTDTSFGGPGTYGLSADYSGRELWDSLIRLYPNVKYVTGGHFIPTTAYPAIHRMVDAGQHGNTIQQFLINYQDDGDNNGFGYFQIMRFSPDSAKVNVSFYSEWLDQYDSRFPAYDIDLNPLNIDNTVTVRGSLVVNNETRLDSTLYIKNLPQSGILYAAQDGLVSTNSGLNFNIDNNAVTVPKITATGNGVFEDSVVINGTAPAERLHVNGTGMFTTIATGNTQYQKLLAASGAAALNVGYNGGYGIAVGRAATGFSAPTMVFYRNFLSTFNTTTAYTGVNYNGVLSFQSPNLFGTAYVQSGRMRSGSSLTGTANNKGFMEWLITADTSASTETQVLYIDPDKTLIRTGVHIGANTTPDVSSILDMVSTTKGALVPRMTGAQQNAISSPATALLIYNTDSSALCYYNGSAWRMVGGTTAGTTFVPTPTNGANVDASTPFDVHYTRVGSTVHFSGTIDIDETLAAGNTLVELSLPIASAFTATTDAAGIVTPTNAGVFGGYITGSIANDRLVLEVIGVSTGTVTYKFTGSYTIK